ncbi:hypothetical protein JHD47_06695 [Sulfurimonas sp. SAG-AH-194-L11]|nr:hypothetical protein [Sulfurimonas sp. SAG-AH-194-L11]MDF1877502.1 hypothetical protein [Sulfurimonas sp. SAG-AH-194-L11]
MKKSILAVVILLLIIVSLPTIGNTFIQNSIDERLTELDSFGLETLKDESRVSYLNTSRHLEFILKDSQSFLNYLSQYSDKQIPPYVNAMLEGILIGTDIKYSNLPFAKAFEIEIYPMQLSQKMSEELQKDDINVYKNLKNFLASKGILYHIKYNLLNSDFKGYIKDIKEHIALSDGTELKISLDGAKFSGNGVLLAPNELSSKIKELHFELLQKEKSLKIVLNKLKSSSNFESINTCLTSVDLDTMFLTLKGTGDDVNISIEQLRANASSNDQGDSTQLNSKTSIKSFNFSSKSSTLNIEKFNFDIAMSGLDKKEYLKLTELLSQSNSMMNPKSNVALQTNLINLLSKGTVLEIANFSIDEFSDKTSKKIKGFSIKSNVTIKEDKELAHKMKVSPFLAIPNISLESELRISKELYTKLQNTNKMFTRLKAYEKEDGDDYIFVVKFVDTKASINAKSIN